VTLFEPDPALHLKPLRGRQIGLIQQLEDAIKEGHRHIMVMGACGFGKTEVSAHLTDRSAKKGKRPMFVAPAISLITQTLKMFENRGIRDIGIIQAHHERTYARAQVQIASRDTLVRRRLPEVDLVMIDEAHDQRDALNAILDNEWKDKIVIGFSATPWSKGLGLHWSKLIVASTMRQMIDEGYATPFRIFSSESDPNMQGVKTVAGEFEEAGTARVMSDDKIIGDAVETWLKHRQLGNHPGDRTFLRGVNRAHAKSIMEAFRAQGIPCGYIDGESTKDERKTIFKRYRSGEDKILASVRVLGVGIDEDVRCLMDLNPTKSGISHVQYWGRGARLADGKTYCLGLDHAGNCVRLGRPEDIHHETLDTRSPKDKSEAYEDEKPAPKPRKCRKCFAIIPPKTKVCPNCGDVYVAPNTIEHVAGELVELGARQMKLPKAKMDEKQAFYSGLLMIAQQRGFKDGWVSHKYQEKFGVWPKGLDRIPRTPRKAVVEFERESRKRYLAEKKHHEEAECLSTTLDQL